MLVAIVSTDDMTVNGHFGKAELFKIYELNETGSIFLMDKSTLPLSIGDTSHSFDEKRFEEVYSKLSGCARIYCTRIGKRPAEELLKRGIQPIEYSGRISDISL